MSSSALRTITTSNTIQNYALETNRCRRVNSPMTNLALDLKELSTGRVTPRRKLSLNNVDTPATYSSAAPERTLSMESGCFVDSPSPVDSPTFDIMCLSRNPGSRQEVPREAVTRRKSVALRRINSMPLPMMKLSLDSMEDDVLTAHQSTPQSINIESAAETSGGLLDMSISTTDDISPGTLPIGHSTSLSSDGSGGSGEKTSKFYIDESSQDSGLGVDRDSRDSKDSEDGFLFAAPKGLPLRRQVKMWSEDTCSPFKYSPVKDQSPSKRRSSCPVATLDFSGEFVKKSNTEDDGSPLKVARLTSMDEGISVDDGFLDVMDAEVAALTGNLPTTSSSSAMVSLFSAPVINQKSHVPQEDDDTPVTRRVMCRRNIARSMSMMARPRGMSLKRSQPEMNDSPMQFPCKYNSSQDESTPMQEQKRPRPASSIGSPTMAISRPTLQRCHSETEAVIKSALNRQASEPDLLGDCSRPHCLPTYSGKHQDLRYISSQTLSQVIDGQYSQEIEEVVIVDCRYPYEFNGGHIKGAKNLYTTEQIISEFLKNPIQPKDPEKRIVLIFHCEFSSERGPKMSRFLRKSDRQANKDCYPKLHYPELYLLDGGYKVYFETEKHNCEPQTYKPMLHKDHSEDLRHFRTKSKSWAGEQRSRPGFRPLKF